MKSILKKVLDNILQYAALLNIHYEVIIVAASGILFMFMYLAILYSKV